MSEVKVAAPSGERWLRGKKYREKYDIGSTTFWSWRKRGLIETRTVEGCVFVKDELPTDTSNQK
jgi:hypothetical protein